MGKIDLSRVAFIPLISQSHFDAHAVVDAKVESVVSKARWYLDPHTTNRPRAFTYIRTKKGSRRLFLERVVMKAPKGKFVRFHNRNTLDCRRENLEIVSERTALIMPDVEQRHKWDIEEIRTLKVNPQRRWEDAWRELLAGTSDVCATH